jgi:hypothetical protein
MLAVQNAKVPVTTPIENVVNPQRFGPAYTRFCQSFGYPRDLVKIHKERLGRQTTTFQGERKMWVWVRATWTVFVNNEKGICFEVPQGSSSVQAWTAWRQYLRLMTA